MLEKYPPKNRVKKRTEYLSIQNQGKKIYSKFFVLANVGKEDSFSSRLGITISTKVHKRAHERNRVKRLVREVFRKNLAKFQNGFDLVFIAKKGIEERSNIEIKKEVKYLLYKVGALK